MIIWTFFQTYIYRYKKCYLPNALRPTSFSYLVDYAYPHSFRYDAEFRYQRTCRVLAIEVMWTQSCSGISLFISDHHTGMVAVFHASLA